MIELNRIYNEDCLIGMQSIDDKSIDCIICDLPYGTTACSWDTIIPFDKLWEQYERIIKDKGAIVLFGQEPFSSAVRMSNLPLYRYDIVWKKQRPSNFQLMGYQCGRVHENIMIFSKANACYTSNGNSMIYNPQTTARDKVRKGGSKIYGDATANILHSYKKGESQKTDKVYSEKQPTSIVEFNGVEHKIHPTQKPVELIEYLIKTYSNEGDIILDNCMGSGTTAIAAIHTNRNFIGFEMNETYFNKACERILSENKAEQSKLF